MVQINHDGSLIVVGCGYILTVFAFDTNTGQSREIARSVMNDEISGIEFISHDRIMVLFDYHVHVCIIHSHQGLPTQIYSCSNAITYDNTPLAKFEDQLVAGCNDDQLGDDYRLLSLHSLTRRKHIATIVTDTHDPANAIFAMHGNGYQICHIPGGANSLEILAMQWSISVHHIFGQAFRELTRSILHSSLSPDLLRLIVLCVTQA